MSHVWQSFLAVGRITNSTLQTKKIKACKKNSSAGKIFYMKKTLTTSQLIQLQNLEANHNPSALHYLPVCCPITIGEKEKKHCFSDEKANDLRAE